MRVATAMKAAAVLAVALVAITPPLFLVVGIVSNISYGFSDKQVYEDAVGSHIDAAIIARTPEGKIAQIDLARSGVVELGLNRDDHGSALPFHQHYGCSVAVSLDAWDTIEERINMVEEFRGDQAGKQTDFGGDGERYSKEMSRIDKMLSGSIGCSGTYQSDSAIYHAWKSREHPVAYYTGLFWFALAAIISTATITPLFGAIAAFMTEEWL